jgi:hypothetical protein
VGNFETNYTALMQFAKDSGILAALKVSAPIDRFIPDKRTGITGDLRGKLYDSGPLSAAAASVIDTGAIFVGATESFEILIQGGFNIGGSILVSDVTEDDVPLSVGSSAVPNPFTGAGTGMMVINVGPDPVGVLLEPASVVNTHVFYSIPSNGMRRVRVTATSAGGGGTFRVIVRTT